MSTSLTPNGTDIATAEVEAEGHFAGSSPSFSHKRKWIARRAKLYAVERVVRKLEPIYKDESRMKSVLLAIIELLHDE